VSLIQVECSIPSSDVDAQVGEGVLVMNLDLSIGCDEGRREGVALDTTHVSTKWIYIRPADPLGHSLSGVILRYPHLCFAPRAPEEGTNRDTGDGVSWGVKVQVQYLARSQLGRWS